MVWQGDLAILTKHLGQRQNNEVSIIVQRAGVRGGALFLILCVPLEAVCTGDTAGGSRQRFFAFEVRVTDNTVLSVNVPGICQGTFAMDHHIRHLWRNPTCWYDPLLFGTGLSPISICSSLVGMQV